MKSGLGMSSDEMSQVHHRILVFFALRFICIEKNQKEIISSSALNVWYRKIKK